jgi:hypothetical protein
MGPKVGTFVAGIGIVIAALAVLVLIRASGLTGGAPAVQQSLGAVGVFFVSVFVFGYGVGKRSGY